MSAKMYPGKTAFAASEYGKERDYWLQKLSGELLKSCFPYDHKKAVGEKGEQAGFDSYDFEFSREFYRQLMELCGGYDQRLLVILAAGLTLLLARYTGSRDITFGLPIFKQETEGKFINTVLVVRNDLEHTINFKELLLQVRQAIKEATENQNYPVETLLYQLNMTVSPGEDFPLFDVSLLLENLHDPKYLQHIKHNLCFSFRRLEDHMECRLQYNAFLYNRGTIERLVAHFKRLLQGAFTDLNAPLSEIDLLASEEWEQLLYGFNDTKVEYPVGKTIDQLFEAQAARTSDRAAVVYEHSILSYRELNEKADRLASHIVSIAPGSGKIIGLMMDHSLEVPVAILAILKAGGAYLPIDMEYPPERKKYILRDSHIDLVLTNMTEIETGARHVLYLGDPGLYKETNNDRGIGNKTHGPDSLAYVMYTSGSTGQPKGVMVEHRNVVRLVKNTNFIGFRLGERILQTGALAFDASTFEIWGALLNGLTLYLSGRDNLLDPVSLKAIISKNDISIMWMTAPLFAQMLDADIDIFKGLRCLVVGGDILSPSHINRVRHCFPGLEVINGYGPTENTTFSTTYRIERDFSDNIPIGRPIANSTAHILDHNDNLQPVGAIGELVVGGDGVSRGYLNQPELTIKSFCGVQGQFFQKAPLAVGDPCQGALLKIYRTGDLARWLSDGSIEFLGRRDQQVKIRGYRIEPGEIEAHILNLDEIKEVVVVVREGENGEKYLCAYCVPSGIGSIDAAGLRLKLSEILPDYMIPLYFISMERLPLTHNKKIDIQALPEPQWSAGANYVPPTNEVEKKLAAIWSEVLGLDREVIGIDDDFFELGGHSLKATILLSRIHKELKIKIPLVEIFSAPTIRELARYIRGKKEDIYTAISPAPRRDHYVLSSAQKRLYLLQQMDPGSTLYNIPLVYILEGRFDKQRMASTFKKVIRRHESLRTSFHTIDHQPVQKVHDEVAFEIEYLSAADDFIRPFDLSCAPLLRVVVVPLAEEKHMLMVDMHHIITDGTSMGIFVRDFKALYIGDTLPDLAVQYKDYSEWSGNGRAGELLKQQETYWLKEFAGELPVLHLPLDFPRPAKQSFEGSSVSFEIGPGQTSQLKALVSEEDETLFILLFSAFTVLLYKLTGQEDIIVGTAAANRGHPDLHHTIGMFVNTLALRNYPTGEKTFSQFLKEVKERTLEAFENQDYPFENLFEKITINRDMSRNPIYDTAFGLQNMEIPSLEFPGLTFVPYHHKNKVSKFDMAWSAAEEGDKLVLQVEYTSKLFKGQTIKKFTNYFKEILAAVIKNKDIRLKDIRISHDQFDRKLNYPQVEFGF